MISFFIIIVPTARAISSGNEGVLVLDGDRQASLNIGSLRQNLATKVMSNGVELIIAGKFYIFSHKIDLIIL